MVDYPPQDFGERSLWGDSATDAVETESLDDSLEADVIVVGAGYTGLSCALHLAEQGVSVVVLEAKSVGFGGSGRNAGLVNAGVWKTPEHVREQLGKEAGDRFNQALIHAPDLVFEIIERYSIDCQAQRNGTINIAHSGSAMRYLEDRCQQLQALEGTVELVDGEASKAMSASDYYCHGGILDRNAGTIQPLSYARGLAKAAQSKGVQLFQDTALSSLERKDNRWLAKSANGEVLADKVVIATNAYSDANSQDVHQTLVPVYIFHCATAPLPEALVSKLIPERHGIWDTQTLMTSTRIDAAGRLVMSCAGSLHGMKRVIRQHWMKRMRTRIFPETKGIPWDYFWTGQVGVTSSKVLRVQLLAPGVFAPAGYNGRGIGPGTVMGMHLAKTLISGNRNEFPFPVEALHREKGRRLRSMFYEYGTLALQCF